MKSRISSNTIIRMLVFVVSIDLIQIGLDAFVIGVILNRFIDVIVWIVLYIWFKVNKVSFKKTLAIVFFGLGFLEFIPVVDVFPIWTIDVIAVYILVKAEDKLKKTSTEIMSNPQTQKLVKQGIIKGVNAVTKSYPALAAASKVLDKINTASNGDGARNQNSNTQNNREPLQTNNSQNERLEKIRNQQNRKSNSSNADQKRAA